MESEFQLDACCRSKLVDAATAISEIKSGSKVFIGTGCGEPQHLIHSLVNDRSKQDLTLYQMLSITLEKYLDDESFLKRFALKAFFISRALRKAAFEGKIDYIPAYLSQIPHLFSSGRIGFDVALIQVSPPDHFGFCSLGVSVDITRSGLESASMVIAQINPQMPRTWGDSFIHVDNIDYLVVQDEPLVEGVRDVMDNEVSHRIGRFVAQLVEDGSTVQIGFGQLPYRILRYLDGKKDLGIHTQVITDGFLPLFEKGVITNRRKTLLPGRVVASLCMGSKKIYDFVDGNPAFYFRSSDFVNDPTVIARNDNLVSISSALEVDLTGQVCTDSVGYRFYSGIGDQVDFLRGSAMSKGGLSIIALPSTAQNGTVSRIVSHLSEGAGVATTRGDINYVVTEYGIAELQGKGIYQRVVELAQIAHPRFREGLIRDAKRHHYIFPDQLPPAQEDLLFLEAYKKSFKVLNGKTVELRAMLPSDEFAARSFFYSLEEDTIYQRYFSRKRLFSHEVLQKQWSRVDYRNNMTVVGIIRENENPMIVAIGSYARMNETMAEVAFVVREDFQGMGVGSYLLEMLEAIARENGIQKFWATVLQENKPMMTVFKKRYPNAGLIHEYNEVYIDMAFVEEAN